MKKLAFIVAMMISGAALAGPPHEPGQHVVPIVKLTGKETAAQLQTMLTRHQAALAFAQKMRAQYKTTKTTVNPLAPLGFMREGQAAADETTNITTINAALKTAK